MEIFKKLHEARKFIKTLDEAKQGFNDYSKYKYYTPEQISKMVFMACEDQGIIPIFNLIQSEIGLSGTLEIYNIEDENDNIKFEMATGIPEIKATNITQQLGGAVTYTERYLLMTAFDIKDNNLDPDSKDHSKQPGTTKQKSTISEWMSETLFTSLQKNITDCNTLIDLKNISDIIQSWKVAPKGTKKAFSEVLAGLGKAKQIELKTK